jgi:hypothetical protein
MRRRAFSIASALSLLLWVIFAVAGRMMSAAPWELYEWHSGPREYQLRLAHGSICIYRGYILIADFELAKMSAFFALLPGAWVLHRAYLLERRRNHELSRFCPACGYNLTGNTSGVCPECGAAIK